MIVGQERIAAVLSYLIGFGDADSSVLFTPVGGRVIASVDDDRHGIYATCVFEPRQPLAERFGVNLRLLHAIATVMDEGGELSYTQGSNAIFIAGDCRWCFPYYSLAAWRPQPEVQPDSWIEWDRSFAPLLKIFSQSVAKEDTSGCLDCVMIDTHASYFSTRAIKQPVDDTETQEEQVFRGGHRTMVSSDKRVMTIFREGDIDYPHTANLLIERRHIPQIIATCESGAKVEIRIGLNHYSVQCGRRMATFGIRRGVYPKSWNAIFDASRRRDTEGTALMTRKQLSTAVRQSLGDTMRVERKDESVWFTDGESSEIRHDGIESSGTFGPVTLRKEYLGRLCGVWPADELAIDYRGTNQFVKVSSNAAKGLTTVIMPVGEKG